MAKVTNLKIDEIDFSKNKSPEFKQCLELVPDLINILPKNIKYKVRFELHNANSDLANAIRRTIMSETPVKSLDYHEHDDIDISDPYILSDFIKKQINLVPINQDIDISKYSDYSIELTLENRTDEIIDVKTSDFIIKKSGKKINVAEIMSPLIVLCRLRPGEHIYIKNINIIEGIGRNDSAAFSNISNIYYKPLDVIPLDSINGTGISSMVSNPKSFMIGYSTHRNTIDPTNIIVNACNTLIKRLEVIYKDFINIENKSEYYYSDLIQLETNGVIKEIQLKNENWTLSNLIARYCYILTEKNIKFISSSIAHPEKEIGVLRITHPEFSKLIQNAIKKSIDELSNIINGIKK